MNNKTVVEVDTKTFVRFWLVIAGIVTLFWVFMKAQTAIVITLLAIFLAIAIRPLARKIDLGVKKRRGPTTASSAVLALLLVLIFVILTVGLVGPMMVSETQKFVAAAPEMFGGMNGLDEIGAKLGVENLTEQVSLSVKNYFTGMIPDLSSTVMMSVSTIAGFMSSAILVVVLTLLFMIQGPELVNEFWKKMYKKGDKTGAVVKRVTTRIAGVIEKYVTGQVMVAIIDAMVVFILVAILSVIFGFNTGLAFPLALISMVLILIPMFGAIIATIINSLLVIFQSPIAGLIFLVIYVIYQQIENNVISPKIQSNSLNLPTLMILISITFGMYMFGLIGAIISIPIAGIIKVLMDEYPNIRALREKSR